MTFLRNKFAEANELLLKVREKQFVYLVANDVLESTEFIQFFFVGLLQSKKWHLSDNHHWKVLEFVFHEDVYSETIEKILEKNNFTDRRVSLDFEGEIIRSLRASKTSLNKIYRTFQYAFNFNYLFCIQIATDDEKSFLKLMNEIDQVFGSSARKKTEPLYCIISLNKIQLESLKRSNKYSEILVSENIYMLPALNKSEIDYELNQFELFKTSKESLRADLIEDIETSENILLQLKNAVSKLKAGIMPVRESGHRPLKIKKEEVKNISNSNQSNSGNKENENEIKDVQIEILDKIYQRIGTRYQQNNFRKILLVAFNFDDTNQLICNDVEADLLSKIFNINDKDIINSLSAFKDENYVIFNPEIQGTIHFKRPDLFYKWSFLKEITDQKAAFYNLFEKINNSIHLISIDQIIYDLSDIEQKNISESEVDIFLELFSDKFPSMNQNINLIRKALEINIRENLEVENGSEITLNTEKSKISFSKRKEDASENFKKDSESDIYSMSDLSEPSEEEKGSSPDTQEPQKNLEPEIHLEEFSEKIETQILENTSELFTEEKGHSIAENSDKNIEINTQIEARPMGDHEEIKKNLLKIRPTASSVEIPEEPDTTERIKLTFKKKE